MELFKIFFCNFVYYHRHTKYGDRDSPIFLTFLMIYLNLCCYFFMIVSLLDMFVISIPTFLFEIVGYVCIPIFIIYIYWRIIGNKRYVAIIRNPKYYSRRCKVISVLFPLLSLICVGLTAFLMWARNNELI